MVQLLSAATVSVSLMAQAMLKTCLQGALALPHVQNVNWVIAVSTIILLVVPRISLLLVASGVGGECSQCQDVIRALSPTVGPGSTYDQMRNRSMSLLKSADLVRESRAAVIANLEVYQQVNGCYALPRMRVQEMLEVIDRY